MRFRTRNDVTRISMRGRTQLVEGTMHDVSNQLDGAYPEPAWLQPVWFEGEPQPEVVAVLLSDVLMLADATPGGSRLIRAPAS